MQLYITLPLTFAVVALTLLYWRLTRDTSLQAVRRKERLRVYFVRALDLNGEVADSLWFHDCWLTQGNESEKHRATFAEQLCTLCLHDFGIRFVKTAAGYEAQTENCGWIIMWLYREQLRIFLQDTAFNSRQFSWLAPNQFRDSRSAFGRASPPVRVYGDFYEWREKLLKTLTYFAMHQRLK